MPFGRRYSRKTTRKVRARRRNSNRRGGSLAKKVARLSRSVAAVSNDAHRVKDFDAVIIEAHTTSADGQCLSAVDSYDTMAETEKQVYSREGMNITPKSIHLVGDIRAHSTIGTGQIDCVRMIVLQLHNTVPLATRPQITDYLDTSSGMGARSYYRRKAVDGTMYGQNHRYTILYDQITYVDYDTSVAPFSIMLKPKAKMTFFKGDVCSGARGADAHAHLDYAGSEWGGLLGGSVWLFAIGSYANDSTESSVLYNERLKFIA